MNMLHFCGYVFTSAIMMGHCVLRAASTEESQPDNFIGFASAPDEVADGSAVHVRYRCSGPCRLTVEVVVHTVTRSDLVVFKRKWINSTPEVFRVQQVLLRFPPSILYRRDFFNRRVWDVRGVVVRGWLDRLNNEEPGRYYGSTLRIYKALQMEPLSERPAKPPTGCPSWSALLMWQISSDRIHQCPHEPDVIDMLTFPLASPGDHFGVVRRFQPFTNRGLERARLDAVTQPSVALSVWIYLLKWCHYTHCGIIHHFGGNNAYDSVLMQLTDTGDVIIQARVTTGEDKAFRASVGLPQRKWIRLDCYVQNSMVVLDATWDNETLSFMFEFKDSIHYDDTDGYFVIGGSRFMPGIHGYFGPIKYYRLGASEVRNPHQPESTLQKLDETHQECGEMNMVTWVFLREVTESRILSPINTGVCTPYFFTLWGRYGGKMCRQTWTWKQQVKYKILFHFLETNEEIRAGFMGVKDLRRVLFEEAVATMLSAHNKITLRSTALLKVSSCFGNHKASLLLAAVHLSGLAGHPVHQQQGHAYSLIGASGDDRFALMHAGYKHTQGIDGFPKDLDVAYSYYANAGTQSVVDSSRMHENEQHAVEHIYLSNPEDLNSLTHESSDVFHFLKYQAERGDVESQRRLGTLLYWGQHGVSKDIASAVKWFERSALQMEDPSAMYDYSILLMKGEGVKKNYSRGYKLMKKAAAMGSINALNGLGWYHGIILNDHKTAVKYFEQAALNGSADGMFNLGFYHLNGENPDKPRRNETAAFLHFLNASRLGHLAASVEAAWYLSSGSLEGVSQDVERAVIMLKKVCEQNGHLGFMIRDALQAYLQGAQQGAFVRYVLAAETGLGLAQSNAAHLCEELNLSDDCQWRYHNYSILNYDPHPSALLKMGDHYYGSSLSSVGQAISMYGRAALAGSPQGMYNLVLLTQQGHVLPSSVHGYFNVSHDGDEEDIVVKILKRCVETEGEGAVTPCSLALLRVQMGKALRRMTQNGAQLLLAYASLLSVVVIAVIVPLQSCLDQRVFAPVRQDGVNLNREEHGIMGGNRRLRRTCDVAVTLSGVCLSAFWTALLYHLL